MLNIAKSLGQQEEEARVLGASTKDIPAQEETLKEIETGTATPSSIDDDTKTVAIAGVAEPLTAISVPCVAVLIQALRTNTGYIYVGGVNIAAGRGVELTASETIPIAIDDLNKVYIDASVNGEGVSYIYVS